MTMAITLVKDLMTEVVETLRVGDTLDLAAHLMKVGRIRHLPVVDGREHLVGLVTHRRILSAWVSHGHPGSEAPEPLRMSARRRGRQVGRHRDRGRLRPLRPAVLRGPDRVTYFANVFAGPTMNVMRSILTSVAFVAFAVAVLGAPAQADIPPPDACTAPGQPCANAGPAHDQAGTCTMSTCTKTVPSPDGGTMSMSYQCNLCKVANGGGGGGGATGSGGAGGNKPPESKDSGCTVGGGGSHGGEVLVFAGVLGLLRARRRRP
jgi:MYXO-CTERM domain-containing protein